MARKGKIQRNKATEDRLERPVRFKKYQYLFLVVCEDQLTERRYFEKFKDLFPENTLYLEAVGTGLDPFGVTTRALEERELLNEAAKREVDEIWVVFDRDDAHLSAARTTRFRNAFELAEQENIRIAYSNEVFELWLLLHLINVDHAAPIPRNNIYIGLQEAIRAHPDYADFEYVHGNAAILDIIDIIGEENTAIERATVLEMAHNGAEPINADPSTMVHRLVLSLREWITYFNFIPE